MPKTNHSTINKNKPPTGFIGAVIVTYQTSADQLQRCLKSLQQNDIQDISIINNDTNNLGFAAAANLGAAKLTNELLLFINPDAQLIPNTMNKASQLLRNQQRIGILGLMLCGPDYQNETNCYGPSVTPISLFTRHLFPKPIISLPQLTGWVSGGAMIVKQSTWQELSGFDPRFFLYWEDVDLCFRARSAAWTICIMPSIKVIHERGSSMQNLTHKTLLYDQSADKYFQKHYSKPIWFFQHYSRRLYRLLSHSVD